MMDERELRRALDAYVARRLPLAPDLWPTIRARVVAYRHLQQAGERSQDGQGARRDAVVGGAGWRPRVAAIGNVVATLALLLVVALVLTLVAGGGGDRRGRGMGMPTATSSLVVPPGQPYPVPADCPVTPLRGPEERDGYVVYWLDSNGLTIGIERGLLFDGVTEARLSGFQKIEGRLDGGPSAPLNFGMRDGMTFGAIGFPAPGCWSIAGRGWQDRENRFFATVYVYPRQCRVRTIACLGPDGTVYLPDGTVHLTPAAVPGTPTTAAEIATPTATPTAMPQSIVAAEAEGRAFPTAPPPQTSAANFARPPGTGERRCVAVDSSALPPGDVPLSGIPVGSLNGLGAGIRSGEFVAGPLVSYAEDWARDPESGKIWWLPLHTNTMTGLTIRAILLDDPSVSRTFTAFSASGGDGPFYPSVVRLPQPGHWMLIATAGPDWGCFTLTIG